ncbi:ATP-dependent bile acid permease [Purpureocillium lavendulum]|uniref:ATP-dependent bile acid permease n=1 Tax=Purpureocillium lavendulum TaxID=1247861 RepID=A0AB34FWJ0_9HYPO|nr:ATP-dependent bile acid permease [Purpureocillium lavendulum]
MTLTATVDEWLSWLAQSRLSIPLYAQLASALFESSMHRKETRTEGDQFSEADDGDGGVEENVTPNKPAEELAVPAPSLVNLVAVDTQRIADFLAICPMIPITGLKTIISAVFLFQLVGWKSLLAGLAAITAIAPINTRLSTKYGGSQMKLMGQRDGKAAVVTELLNGITQVKFSALELAWIGRVGKLRQGELAAQRKVFRLETGLVCTWILAPVLLSAIVLGTFALIHGGLTASVAFTTLSIFGELEIWLAVLPLLFSQLLQAWTSLTRIENELGEPRMQDSRRYSTSVCMDSATIAWPSESGTNRRAGPVLRNVTVSFPDSALSIVVGKTGSGKSMLLASILGDCDVLDGKVSAPLVVSQGGQLSSGMAAPWIISSAYALVAQMPWIRSASVKDNILFELPYDGARYRQVLYACALNHDVQRWPDGDETVLGEDGVNLSGGQKWRISLARALYSRAHTIVIDDIFSALDANTARHPWWISIWTRSSGWTQANSEQRTDESVDNTAWYMGIYLSIAFGTCVIGTLRYHLVLTAGLRASRLLFNEMLHAVVFAPLTWHHTVPSGRVLNRFTVDFHLVDSKLINALGSIIYSMMYLLAIVIAGCMVSLWALGVALLCTAACVAYARKYLKAAREIKRLESNTRSPIMDHLASSMTGLQTIRAYGCVDKYIGHMHAKVDRHSRAAWYLALTNRWLALRLSLLGALFSVLTGTSVLLFNRLSASEVGFVLGFALKFSATVDWAIRQYASFELDMNAAERCLEYSDIIPEAGGGDDVDDAWPTAGRLRIENLSLGYDMNTTAVDGVSLSIEPNTRLGVVGRTGAGKSTLALGIFRFLEAQRGSIILDGRNIAAIKISDLRSRIAIVPQDPFLFSGTIRSNIDPLERLSDYELLGCLEAVYPGLRSAQRETLTLDSHVSAGGKNLSHGQRQFVCLARAMVAPPRFLILDEATSAVDNEADICLQAIIRANFGINGSSVLVIAHRIRTVVDFDRIVVMDCGRVVEFGAPTELYQREEGHFRRLVNESNDMESLVRILKTR